MNGEISDEQKKQDARDLYNKIMQKAGDRTCVDDIDDYMKNILTL